MQWVTGQVVECDGGLALRSPIDSYSAPRAGLDAPSVKMAAQPVADDADHVVRAGVGMGEAA